jgi:hypothetical protein
MGINYIMADFSKANGLVSCKLKGGLGNQLFQIFTTISYAMDTNRDFVFINTETTLGNRKTYWDSFFKSLKDDNKLVDELDYSDFSKYNETSFHYSEISDYDNMPNISLNGYFQSESYFLSNYNFIKQLLLNNVIQNCKLKFSENNYSQYTSIHFRIGDYKSVQDFHPILPYDYYRNSIQYLLSLNNNEEEEKPKFLLFYEIEDIHIIRPIIKKFNEEFPHCIFEQIEEGLNDWEELIIMSFCKNNIIANSTFSFWSGYLNENPNKIICYPDVWFGKALASNNTYNLIPKLWTKISTKNDYVLLILNCVKYDKKRIKQKEGWLKTIPHDISYYHIIGDPTLLCNNFIDFSKRIIYVRCQDDYNSLCKKTYLALEAVHYTFNYKYVLKTDDDQELINPKFFDIITKLLSSPINKYHYGGNIIDVKIPYFSKYFLVHPELPKDIIIKQTKYCNGRFYFLSNDAISFLLTKKREILKEYLEDYVVGLMLNGKYTPLNIKSDDYFKDIDNNKEYDPVINNDSDSDISDISKD